MSRYLLSADELTEMTQRLQSACTAFDQLESEVRLSDAISLETAIQLYSPLPRWMPEMHLVEMVEAQAIEARGSKEQLSQLQEASSTQRRLDLRHKVWKKNGLGD